MAKQQSSDGKGPATSPTSTARPSFATTTGGGLRRCGVDVTESVEDDMDELLRTPPSMPATTWWRRFAERSDGCHCRVTTRGGS
jgi:hypothetical protein